MTRVCGRATVLVRYPSLSPYVLFPRVIQVARHELIIVNFVRDCRFIKLYCYRGTLEMLVRRDVLRGANCRVRCIRRLCLAVGEVALVYLLAKI